MIFLSNLEEKEIKQEVEVEYKAMISKDEYQDLLEYFSEFAEVKEPYTQTNYYFDTEDNIFIKQGITIRLRNIKDFWELQIKIPKHSEGDFNCQEEVSHSVSEEEANRLISEGINKKNKMFADLVSKKDINVGLINMIGNLQTNRNDYLFYTDKISLDENIYLGTTDYELEWETSNHKYVKYQIDQLYLELTKNVGKATRFLDRLKHF